MISFWREKISGNSEAASNTDYKPSNNIATSEAFTNLDLIFLSCTYVLSADNTGELFTWGKRNSVNDTDGKHSLQGGKPGDGAQYYGIGGGGLGSHTGDAQGL